jgi:hypothetical protein
MVSVSIMLALAMALSIAAFLSRAACAPKRGISISPSTAFIN